MSRYRNMQSRPLAFDTVDGNAFSIGAHAEFEIDAATERSPKFSQLIKRDKVRRVAPVAVNAERIGALPPVSVVPLKPVIAPAPKVPEFTPDIPGTGPLIEPLIDVVSDDFQGFSVGEEKNIESSDTVSDDSDGPEGDPGEQAADRRARRKREKKQR